MAGTSRNLDRRVLTGAVDDIRLLKDDYRQLWNRGVDIIETDIPVELSRIIATDFSGSGSSRAKYFSKIPAGQGAAYKIVDTGQEEFFNNDEEIPRPAPGAPFYGQDAHYSGRQPAYVDNGDGTITDEVTGLQWQKDYQVMTYEEALAALKTLELAGTKDWRLPSIKEAYSLILFSGVDVSGRDMTYVPKEGRPFLDTDYFDFEYGSNGERIIDVQMLSSTVYRGTTMGGNETVFGVNFADGRIKGYPIRDPRMGAKKFTVRFVRGNPDYGKNDFVDNGDGTISDRATGLMWEQTDSKRAMTWEEALAWAQLKNAESYLGYSDWRLPNAKELQSIVDYSRSPQSTNSAAIDPHFQVSGIKDEAGRNNYPFYWTSTTHKNRAGGRNAVYICFGEGLGFFGPPGSPRKQLMDVHGAGAQRSDPKTGNAADFPQGHGPQGDVVRIEHYVRLMRDF